MDNPWGADYRSARLSRFFAFLPVSPRYLRSSPSDDWFMIAVPSFRAMLSNPPLNYGPDLAAASADPVETENYEALLNLGNF